MAFYYCMGFMVFLLVLKCSPHFSVIFFTLQYADKPSFVVKVALPLFLMSWLGKSIDRIMITGARQP